MAAKPELPFELWAQIAALSCRKDLPSLARVSSCLLSPSRQVLYQQVSLSNVVNFEEPFRLLRNPIIARRVERLTLYGSPLLSRMVETIEADYNILSLMPNIRYLSIMESSLFDKQENFVKTVEASCPKLHEIQLEVIPIIGGLISEDFSIPNIRRIVWKQQGGITKPFLTLCIASSSTITHLSFPQRLSRSGSNLFIDLTDIEFPQLVSLQLRSWSATADPQSSIKFIRFLKSHPTLEKLSLLCHSDSSSQSNLHIETITSSPAFLPRLRALDAHPDIIQTLVAARAKCLGTVTSLIIPHEQFLRPHDLVDMLSDLADYEYCGGVYGLPGLRSLTLFPNISLKNYLSFGDDNRWLLQSSIAFPLLESWTGDVPHRMTLNGMARFFSRFRRIRELDLKRWPKIYIERTTRAKTFRELADKCTFLHTVKFRNDDGKLADTLSISRNREGLGIYLKWVDDDDDYECW